MKKMIITALMVAILLAPFLFGGCGSEEDIPTGEGFAIYLTRDNLPVDRMEAQSHIAIAETPVIVSDDIIYYDWEKHEMNLTTEAWGRLNAVKVPMNGTPFLVCVDKNPVYWGAFWTPVSSQSFEGVTIRVPSISLKNNIVKIELGYPSPSFFRGEDPRANALIKEALQKAGRLK